MLIDALLARQNGRVPDGDGRCARTPLCTVEVRAHCRAAGTCQRSMELLDGP